jgi:hypothetical protein
MKYVLGKVATIGSAFGDFVEFEVVCALKVSD